MSKLELKRIMAIVDDSIAALYHVGIDAWPTENGSYYRLTYRYEIVGGLDPVGTGPEPHHYTAWMWTDAKHQDKRTLGTKRTVAEAAWLLLAAFLESVLLPEPIVHSGRPDEEVSNGLG